MTHNRIERIAKTFSTLVAILLLSVDNIYGQQLQATQTHYSTDNGMCSNAISYITHDDYGYLWIATWNGLIRFDGYDFYNYKAGAASHIPNLHNRIFDLSVDNQQNIWMRMYDQRVFVMKRSQDRIINPFEGIGGSEEFRVKHPLTITSNGDVLAIIDGVGIYKMRLDNRGLNAQLITTNQLEVTSMAEGYQNDIWLGTNQGIHRMDASNLTVERKGKFLDDAITCLYSNGYNIYAGTTTGKILSFAYGQDEQQIRAASGDAINAIHVDAHGLVWFTDSRMGASYLNPETGKERLFTQDVKVPDYDGAGGAIHETDGVVWVRMNRGGYGYYDREADEVRYFHNDPSNPWNLSNTVNASLELKEGVILESTSRRGLEKLEIIKNNIERHLLVQTTESTPANEVRALYYDNARKTLLMGNKNGSLFLIGDDGNRREITADSQGKPLGRVYGIAGDSQGNLWLSSKDAGVFKMSHTGDTYSIVNFCNNPDDNQSLGDNRAYLTQEDRQGNIWVATYGGGVNMLVKGTTKFIRPEQMKGYPRNSFRKVRTIIMDTDGMIWAGTTDGILLLSYENNEVKVIRMEPSTEEPDLILQSNDIVCFGRDASGTIWLGTNGGGLAHEIGKDSEGYHIFETFGAKDGLPSEEIRSITFDKRGSVWFATDHSICSFDPGKRIFSTFSSLEGVDETLCSEASALTLPNGHIIFGTLFGYYLVDQSKLITSTGSMLRLRFTDFWIDDVLQSPRFTDRYDYYVPDSRSVTLSPLDSKISFRFASLNYQLQHRVHYQYKLEGYDEDWQNADKSRIASYTDLPSGTYRLMVKAFLQESPDKYDQREIEIIVPSTMFLSSVAIWIYMTIAAIILVLLLFLYQKRIKKRMKKQSSPIESPTPPVDVSHNSFLEDMERHEQSNYSFMKQLMSWLEAHYQEKSITDEQFMESTSMSRAEFAEELEVLTGRSPRTFLYDYRLKKACEMLEQTDKSIDDISLSTGFSDPVQFSNMFKSKINMTPSQYRDNKKHGETDEYEEIS